MAAANKGECLPAGQGLHQSSSGPWREGSCCMWGLHQLCVCVCACLSELHYISVIIPVFVLGPGAHPSLSREPETPAGSLVCGFMGVSAVQSPCSSFPVLLWGLEGIRALG